MDSSSNDSPAPLAPYLGISAVIGAVLITLIVYLPLITRFFEMHFVPAIPVSSLASVFNMFIGGIILVTAV